ncbi:MAG TPA: VOC family protein [Phycisphaerae bacterium]|nr:VOC family protein [Phycisphaerales bacterium]HRX84330.1 VOC family protein [Phycisphaerae bacterium]
MPIKTIPDGLTAVTPYLLVHGVDDVIAFLQQTFDAAVIERMENPTTGDVAHAQVRVGNAMIMMGQIPAERPPTPGSLYVYVTDCDATYRRGLDAGGTSVMEPGDQFYGDRNAGVKDAAGNIWWIAQHLEDVSPQELQRRNARRATKD